MTETVTIQGEIDKAKRQLELEARNKYYNFNHPEVLALSQKLDHLIVQAMKEKPAR